MTPPWVLIVQVLDWSPLHKVEEKYSHTDEWCCDGPTKLPEHEWIVSDHVFDAVVKAIYSECPRNSGAFKEDQEQQAEATDSIRIEDLEDVHSTL
jgi:hypothetical protein